MPDQSLVPVNYAQRDTRSCANNKGEAPPTCRIEENWGKKKQNKNKSKLGRKPNDKVRAAPPTCRIEDN